MRLYEFIPRNMERILQEWEEFARGIWPGEVPQVRVLRDHAEEMLLAVAADMRTFQSDPQQQEKSTGNGTPTPGSLLLDRSSARHAVGRAESGFDLQALVAEYRALRASILHLWISEPGLEPAERIDDMTRFNEAVDQLLAESIASYSERVEHSREIFLGILGHDLRSPLHTVSMVAGLLKITGEFSGNVVNLASQILVSTEAMDRMIKDLLDFTGTRLGAKMTLRRLPMDLVPLGREVIEELKAAHPARDFTFEATGDGSGEWDESRLRQLISNLLGNAVQHGASTPPIRLFIDGSGDDVILGVRNQGNPIPKDSLALIFDPMRRSSREELSRPAGSIGLGLYIAREVATTHGGTIQVSSDEKETVFTARLPRAHLPA